MYLNCCKFIGSDKQIDIGTVGTLHIGGHSTHGDMVEQLFALHAHHIHRHLAGYELHTVVDGLLPQRLERVYALSTACAVESARSLPIGQGKTLILFSDDLDKTLATFVLANGAAATGQKVSIFFTFWGLNAIKKAHKPKVGKDLFGRMFSWMLPSDSTRLTLSKMNMMGIGARMMRHIMTRKGVDSLESLRQQAIAWR